MAKFCFKYPVFFKANGCDGCNRQGVWFSQLSRMPTDAVRHSTRLPQTGPIKYLVLYFVFNNFFCSHDYFLHLM